MAPNAFPNVCSCTFLYPPNHAYVQPPAERAEEESEVTDEVSLLDETSDDYRALAASHLRRPA